jgi:hypothetical protein
MSYDYLAERPKLFTEDGQVMFLKIRDNTKRLLTQAGAVRCQEATSGTAGDSWMMLACVDRLVELGELREITRDQGVAGQHRVFVAAT